MKLPRFIRVNNRTSGTFTKLKAKQQGASAATTKDKLEKQKRLIVSQHDNVLVYKQQEPVAKLDPASASSVIFLKPEIDRQMLLQVAHVDSDSIF